ncbi:uncharacterized protein LOC131641055 isoform X2 [Vicia villosa]|uniref:uncharacterized protein LOC131641055 isoform X2 n=1 Tax=Vicia villosa TaxID=3911 RepID=UPI00273C76D3|nr:uncharacterized protein LOC131641055 isoform X2 [Vicia villosa]
MIPSTSSIATCSKRYVVHALYGLRFVRIILVLYTQFLILTLFFTSWGVPLHPLIETDSNFEVHVFSSSSELLEKLHQTWSSVEKQPYPAMYSSVYGDISMSWMFTSFLEIGFQRNIKIMAKCRSW